MKLNRHQRRSREAMMRKLTKQMKKSPKKKARCPECRSTNIDSMVSCADDERYFFCYACSGATFSESQRAWSNFNTQPRYPRIINSDGLVRNRNKLYPSLKRETSYVH